MAKIQGQLEELLRAQNGKEAELAEQRLKNQEQALLIIKMQGQLEELLRAQ